MLQEKTVLKGQKNELFRLDVMVRKYDLTFVRVFAERVSWVMAVVLCGLSQVSVVAAVKDLGIEELVL